MEQNYHVNANTNSHSRAIVRHTNTTNINLAQCFEVGTKTVAKWKKRDFVTDKTSRPNTIHHAISETEPEIIRVVQTLSWFKLDDLTAIISTAVPKSNRSNIYLTLQYFGINQMPQERKQQASTFKEYKHGYGHIDVSYLPKLEGKKQY